MLRYVHKIKPVNNWVDWSPTSGDEQRSKLGKTYTIGKYRTDALVIRTHKSNRTIKPPECSKVGKTPSKKSLQNLVFLLNNCDIPMTTMTTITVQTDVEKVLRVCEAKKSMHAALQRLRREGATQYVWIREHTEVGTPHWHIFHDLDVVGPDEVGVAESRAWSKWWGKTIRKITDDMPCCQRGYHFMENGDGAGFLGCVRVERLRSDAAGRYAGKEGAKRFQKKAPEKWAGSGRWWSASRSVTCTELRRLQVRASSLVSTDVTLPGGEVLDVAFRNQFGRGLARELGD